MWTSSSSSSIQHKRTKTKTLKCRNTMSMAYQRRDQMKQNCHLSSKSSWILWEFWAKKSTVRKSAVVNHHLVLWGMKLSQCWRECKNPTFIRIFRVISSLHRPSDKLENFSIMQQQAVSQTNHINHHKTKTADSDGTRSIIHEVLLEPIHREAEERCSFHKESPATTMLEHPIGSTTLEMDTHTSLPANPTPCALPQSDHMSVSAPVSRVPSRAPSRAASTLPSSVCTRNGLVSTPSPILEPNGIAAGTYQRAPAPPPADPHKHVHRRSALEQVEQWVKVQKAEHKA